MPSQGQWVSSHTTQHPEQCCFTRSLILMWPKQTMYQQMLLPIMLYIKLVTINANLHSRELLFKGVDSHIKNWNINCTSSSTPDWRAIWWGLYTRYHICGNILAYPQNGRHGIIHRRRRIDTLWYADLLFYRHFSLL